MQYEVFKEIECVKNREPLPKASPLLKLSPFLDAKGILRVGGRLDRADLTNEERHPVIIPESQHIASLIAEKLHDDVKHEGRHFTQGIVRAKGY